MESLYAPDSTPQSSEVAEEAIRALAHGLPRAVSQPHDMDARCEALRGAWLAGWALGVGWALLMGVAYRVWEMTHPQKPI